MCVCVCVIIKKEHVDSPLIAHTRGVEEKLLLLFLRLDGMRERASEMKRKGKKNTFNDKSANCRGNFSKRKNFSPR
jgi:hypothetical protein